MIMMSLKSAATLPFASAHLAQIHIFECVSVLKKCSWSLSAAMSGLSSSAYDDQKFLVSLRSYTNSYIDVQRQK
jgi:hypothetical protein